MDSSFDRPSHWLRWAKDTFGDIALDPRERTLRFIEEALELGQVMGITAEDVTAIQRRIDRRPLGRVSQEIGQCLATLELLASVLHVDADHEATAELARVKTIPKEEWTKRHAAKVAIGIAS